MKKQFQLLLLTIFIGLSASVAFGQRGGGSGSVPKVTIHPTISHATCFDQTGDVEYYIEVASPGWTKGTRINRLDLYDASWAPVQSLTQNGCCGSISNLAPGMYIFYGSMTVQTTTGMYVSVQLNFPIWVGIETVWAEKMDMISGPNSYSAKRNDFTVSYGGVRSSNGINSGDGWIEMSAVFGNTTNARVFLMIGETNSLGNFNPSSIFQQYIEFYKGSSGNGIRVWYNDQVSGVWGNYYQSISTNPDDKIRLVRNGTSLSIQKNNSSSNVFTLPQPYSGPMNIAVRTLAEGDGCLDVVSSFSCIEQPENTVDYAELRNKVDGGYALAVGGRLKFTYDEEYAVSPSYLPFNIYDKQRSIVASSDLLGVTTGISSPLNYQEDDARYIIDLSTISGMPDGEFYTLEVIDTKGNKKYLKFFYKN